MIIVYVINITVLAVLFLGAMQSEDK